jgi:carboxymethylenebutenolidase
MKRSLLFAFALVLCVVPLQAQDWAKQKLEKSPRHGEWVTIQAGNRPVKAFVVYPESKSKTAAVVVIHEIFGMTDWVRDLADQVAEAGYIAIAPDLLSGKGPNGGNSDAFASVDDARGAIAKLDPDEITQALNAAADYVKKLPASNGKVAVAGFCWGGGQSFRFATNRPDLSAAFVFYGPPPQKFDTIKAPVYGFYAGNDARIDATIPDAQKAMQAAGKKYDPVTYEGAGHGFMRSGEDPNGRPDDKKARDQAWQRWKALLKGM